MWVRLCHCTLYTCSQRTLHDIASHLHLVPPLAQCPSPLDRELLLALLVARHERRQSQLDEVNDAPLYPTEEVLWDENVVPSDYYNGESEDDPLFVATLTYHMYKSGSSRGCIFVQSFPQTGWYCKLLIPYFSGLCRMIVQYIVM